MSEAVEETRLCPACDTERPLRSFIREADGAEYEECYRCRVSSIAVGVSSDFATRTPRHKFRQPTRNSYNAGIPTDARGMPWLDSSMRPIGQKEFDQRKHEIEEFERRRRQAPAAPTAS